MLESSRRDTAVTSDPSRRLQWRSIVDSAVGTAIVGLDLDRRVTHWSRGAEALLGWTEAEILGAPLDRLFPREDCQNGVVVQLFAEATASDRGIAQAGWRVDRNGQRIWATGELSSVREDGQIVGFINVLRDFTAQREMEVSLRAERRALEILNRAGIALSVEPDLRKLVQIVTDNGVELTRAAFGAFFYTAVDEAGEVYMPYAVSGAPLEAFAKFPLPRKTAIFAPSFEGAIIRSHDITQDPRYGRSAPHFGMPEGHLPVRSYLAVPVFSRNGNVLGTLFFGHAEAGVFCEAAERNLQALAAEAAIAVENAHLAQAAQREIAGRLAADEALRQMNLSLEQQVADRTEKLRLNEEALRQAQKMEAIGQLTGGVAHDFNNLLQVIMGNIEIIERNLPKDMPRLQQAVAQAMSGADRAALMTQRLLAFSRKQPLAPKCVNVNEEVVSFSTFAHRTLGERISVQTKLDAGLWAVEVDPTALHAALINLAVNARDAMPSGGTLTISTINRDFDCETTAQVPELPSGQYVAITVSDTGEGMSDETSKRVFEPFFTTKPVGKGTGLGLSQVYGFAKQSGGHARIISTLGSGTSVELYLPRMSHRPAEAAAVQSVSAPAVTCDATVLVVEDDADVRALSVQTLVDLGYTVLSARDASSAMRQLANVPSIDLLFCDVVLPGDSDGAQLAAEIIKLRPQIKVLFTTGYGRQAIFRDGRLDPGINLITKPFSSAALADRVREVLAQGAG
jgi:PAS domain S-box-containing protein